MAREMKDSGVEWIGEVPIDWAVTNIGRLFEVKAGGDAKVDLYSDEKDEEHPYPVYTNTTVSNQVYAYTSLPVFDENTITVTGRGEVGRAFFRKEKYDAIIRLLVLKPKLRLDSRYYTYWIDTVIVFFTNSAAIGQLSAQQILPYKVCFLPYREQQKIADYLDKKCAELNNVLEKTRASIEEYKKLKQAVITQAVTKGLRGDREMKDSGIEWIGEIPSEWKIIRIKWVLSERKEKSESGEEEPLSMSQKYGIIPTREMKMIPNMASSFIGAKIVYSGDLVFNKLKAHLGVFAVSQYNGIVSPDYAVYCTKGIVDVKYLEYLFKTPQYISEFRKKSSGVGAGLTRLYTDELYSIYCLLPSWNEQEEIICYLNKKIKEIDNLIEKKEQYLSEIENYKKSLIYEYVTGKKEV